MTIDLFSSALSNDLQLEPLLAEARLSQTERSMLRNPDDNGFGAFLQAPLVLRTLGADRGYKFATYELTPNALFVVCNDMAKYPFKMGSTIVQGVLQITTEDQRTRALVFLGKIESMAMPSEASTDLPGGFVLRIIQMNFDERELLEKLIVNLSKSVAA